jgi:four helix bundle protein
MPKPYDLRQRSFLFACDAVAFCRIVADRGYILSRLAVQLVRSASAVGANLEEAADGQSKPDFIAKNCIALKEAREARFLATPDRCVRGVASPWSGSAARRGW